MPAGKHDVLRCQTALTTKTTEAELAQHRLQGHTPYHPACKYCQVSRSVFQHRRRVDGRLESEVCADFFFLSATRETQRSIRADNIRVLVLTERMSAMIGAVVTSGDLVKTRTELVQWLREFGLESGRCSISLVTDSEDAVSDLVAVASEEFVFRVCWTFHPNSVYHSVMLLYLREEHVSCQCTLAQDCTKIEKSELFVRVQ